MWASEPMFEIIKEQKVSGTLIMLFYLKENFQLGSSFTSYLWDGCWETGLSLKGGNAAERCKVVWRSRLVHFHLKTIWALLFFKGMQEQKEMLLLQLLSLVHTKWIHNSAWFLQVHERSDFEAKLSWFFTCLCRKKLKQNSWLQCCLMAWEKRTCSLFQSSR